MSESDISPKDFSELRYCELQGLTSVQNSIYPNNSITSSKYTKYSFIPKTLFIQFMNPAKIWFLLITVLELTSINENLSINIGTLVPLMVLLLTESVREGYNDFLRHKSDDALNYVQYPVWDGGCFAMKNSKEILVGDIVLLYNNDYPPADIMILVAGNPENECYVEASAVFGESSLKIKHAVKDTQLLLESSTIEESSSRLKSLNDDLHVLLPNPNFKRFYGRLKLKASPKSTKVNINNIIFRGMKISNTAWIFGVAIYTGLETKVWINYKNKRSKSSKIQKIVDKWIWTMMPIIGLVCVINTITYSIINNDFPYTWQKILSSNIILFGHMIPISLVLSIEIIRLFLYFVIQSSSEIGANTSNLFSNLGMVEYIVSDKTGTITENDLRICFCILQDKVYWDTEENISQEDEELNSLIKDRYENIERNLEDSYTLCDLARNFVNSPNYITTHYLTCMAMCNLAFPDGSSFIAMSVDDKELAQMASKLGVRLINRDNEMCHLNISGHEALFDVIGNYQFSSETKKSRVLVRNRTTREVVLYVKGNRESLSDLYNEDYYENEALTGFRTIYFGYKEMTETECQEFISEYNIAKLSPVNSADRLEGVFCKYEKQLEFLGIVGLEDSISEETKKTVSLLKRAGIKFWILSGDSEESTLNAASTAGVFFTDDKILHLTNINSEIEFANIIQDHFRDGVFESNLETDGNNELLIIPTEGGKEVFETKRKNSRNRIAKSFKCSVKLIPGSELKSSKSIARKTIMRKQTSLNPLLKKFSMAGKKIEMPKSYNPERVNYVVSIDSTGLEHALSSKQNNKVFISLLFAAKAVCFHSLYPENKKKVVKMLKSSFNFNPLVLSIGDGISDIGMIQEADIGIGINGKEGPDAANSSDISIQHFYQLKNLLMVDGHKIYIQLSKLILLSYYAMSFIMTEVFIYNCIEAFTSTSIMQKEFYVVYRLVASVIPMSGMCLLDIDSSSTRVTPQSYKVGIFNALLTKKNLFLYILIGFLQGVVTSVLTFLKFKGISYDGYPENGLLIGSTITMISFSTVLASGLVETFTISFKVLFVYLGSIILLISLFVPFSYTNTSFDGFLNMMSYDGSIWTDSIICVAVNVTITYFFKSLRFIFFPGILELARGNFPELSLYKKTRLDSYKKSFSNVYRDSSLLKNNIVSDSEEMNLKFMRFVSKYREKLYKDDKITENKSFFCIFLLIGGLGSVVYSVYKIAENPFDLTFTIYSSVYSISLSVLCILPIFQKLKDYTSTYLIITLLATQVFYFISQILFKNDSLDLFSYIPVLYIIGFSNYWLEITSTILFNLFFIIFSVVLFVQHESPSNQWEIIISYLVIYTSICFTACIVSYYIDYSGRIEFNLVQKVQIEIQKTKSVLSYLLPEFVRKRVKDGVRYISEDQGVISVVFCDIYNFEEILKVYTAKELTLFLDDLFGKFDQKCSLSGCTKIETVGKTYMACAGLKDSKIESESLFSSVSHARRAIEMGLAIVNLCERTLLKNGESLKVKIGINSGPVTAGVVGYHKPQFSLVGDTVNTASRMASLCPAPNNIQISNETFLWIKDPTGLTFKPHMVIAKGKGQMKTYLVSILIKEAVSSTNSTTNEFFSRSNKDTKKLTLYQFSNSNKETPKRRTSALEDLNQVILEEGGEFRKNETQELEEIRFFSLKCEETAKETAFRLEFSRTNLNVSKLGLKIRVFCDLVFLVLAVVGSILSKDPQTYTISKLVIELLLLFWLWNRFDRDFCKLFFSWCLAILYLSGAVLRLIDFSKNDQIVFLDYLLYLLQASFCSQLFFSKLSFMISFVAVVQLILCITFTNEDKQHIISSFIFLLTLLFTMFSREKKIRIYSKVKTAAEKELVKTDELLQKMMPKNALEQLKEQSLVAEYIHGVSILYADIAGFTQWSSNKPPNEVVEMLSSLFTEFDYSCGEYNVYKVHTIGDCYVALGYTGNKLRSEADECYNLARFALSLVEIIEKVNMRNGINLGMRIGMHTGDIIGGIAGTNIVRYDIYGADVLLANKMESTGQLGKVHISGNTMNILKNIYPDEFTFVEAGNILSPITETEISTYFLDYIN